MNNDKWLILNNDQVQAILYRNKTQFRQVASLPFRVGGYVKNENGKTYITSNGKLYDPTTIAPYQVGDIIYVKEGWSYLNVSPEDKLGDDTYYYRADDPDIRPKRFKGTKFKPNIHMPREAARLFLRIMSVRFEKLQDISHEDAAEEMGNKCDLPKVEFMRNWERNIKPNKIDTEGWEANPFVFVYEFERVTELKHVGKYMLIP